MIACPGIVTTYGYPGDSTPDANSSKAIGAWDNPLGPISLAVSRDVEAALCLAGFRPRAKLLVVLADGQELLRQWDDRTARSYHGKPLTGRYDFFCPSGRNPLEDRKVAGFRRP